MGNFIIDFFIAIQKFIFSHLKTVLISSLFTGFVLVYHLYEEVQKKNFYFTVSYSDIGQDPAIFKKDIDPDIAQEDSLDKVYSFSLKPIQSPNKVLQFELNGTTKENEPNVTIYASLAKLITQDEQIMSRRKENEEYDIVLDKTGKKKMNPVILEFVSLKDFHWGYQAQNKKDIKIKSFEVVVPISYQTIEVNNKVETKMKDLHFQFTLD